MSDRETLRLHQHVWNEGHRAGRADGFEAGAESVIRRLTNRADGLHFAGRLKDERVLREALAGLDDKAEG